MRNIHFQHCKLFDELKGCYDGLITSEETAVILQEQVQHCNIECPQRFINDWAHEFNKLLMPINVAKH